MLNSFPNHPLWFTFELTQSKQGFLILSSSPNTILCVYYKNRCYRFRDLKEFEFCSIIWIAGNREPYQRTLQTTSDRRHCSANGMQATKFQHLCSSGSQAHDVAGQGRGMYTLDTVYRLCVPIGHQRANTHVYTYYSLLEVIPRLCIVCLLSIIPHHTHQADYSWTIQILALSMIMNNT